MTTAAHTNSISLSTAAALTGRSTRTWQRRIEEGMVPRVSDASGRTLVPLKAVRPMLDSPWSLEDLQILLCADRGDASAQADMGARFALTALRVTQNSGGEGTEAPDPTRVAHYFLRKAAEQGESEAMHWLGVLCAAGLCEGKTDANAQALMWISKAAEHGHAIAQEQLNALLAFLAPGGRMIKHTSDAAR